MTDPPHDQPAPATEGMSGDQLRAVAQQLREQAAMLERMAHAVDRAANPASPTDLPWLGKLPLPLSAASAMALAFAEAEARRFNHNYLGTEHLLLGIAGAPDPATSDILARFGFDLPKARRAIEFIIGRGDRIVAGDLALTPRSKQVLTFAAEEARRLGATEIGQEHLLLGIIREGEGIAAGVLQNEHIPLDQLRASLLASLPRLGAESEAQP